MLVKVASAKMICIVRVFLIQMSNTNLQQVLNV